LAEAVSTTGVADRTENQLLTDTPCGFSGVMSSVETVPSDQMAIEDPHSCPVGDCERGGVKAVIAFHGRLHFIFDELIEFTAVRQVATSRHHSQRRVVDLGALVPVVGSCLKRIIDQADINAVDQSVRIGLDEHQTCWIDAGLPA
jgi:hypothetical protein